ncbi:MAG: hypothetical protein IPK13_02610 [Deltaproteobacteria bacterium]|nr:hypothetical protein [Deltaproteobacteria bacterium]
MSASNCGNYVLTPPFELRRRRHDDGGWMVLGGADNFGNAVATARVYDPVQNQRIERQP